MRFVGRHVGRESGQLGCIRICVNRTSRHRLQHRHALQHGGHVLQCRCRTQAVQAQRFGALHHGLAIPQSQCPQQAKHMGTVHAAQHQPHHILAQAAGAKGNRLVGQTQRIAHGAPGGPSQQAQRWRIDWHGFGTQHALKVFANGFGRHRTQIELQAAGQDGDRHLLRVGGR